MDVIVNKVAESSLITLDLVPYLPAQDSLSTFDLKPFLFREMILREKDYRTTLPAHDWSQYAGKHVAVFCSADAIIPVWAYMLAASFLQPVATSVFFGTPAEMEKNLIQQNINNIDLKDYTDQRVVIKGCGDIHVPEFAYVAITSHLRSAVKSLMYGEPCSTVPIYKKPMKA